jgi:hypothetical protein
MVARDAQAAIQGLRNTYLEKMAEQESKAAAGQTQ